MTALPGWLRDMEKAPSPHIVAEGEDRGAIVYLDRAASATAQRAGTHIDVTGRDMTTFDLDAEAAKRKPRARQQEPDPETPAEPATATPADEATGKTRVGRYANRALVTKPGERN